MTTGTTSPRIKWVHDLASGTLTRLVNGVADAAWTVRGDSTVQMRKIIPPVRGGG